MTKNPPNIIKAQKGYQEKVLSCSADIVISGGAAGAGKTFALEMEPLRHIHIPKFGGVIFRREITQITSEGGLWDTAMSFYPNIGARMVSSPTHKAVFNSGSKLQFSGLQQEKDVLKWQGSQIAFLGFDELTHFTEKQFFYLLSRNRSTCGIRPYCRATCNPDPDSWVREFIDWWIDPVSGYILPERDGVIRYFTRDGDNIVWGSSPDDVVDQCGHIFSNPAFKDTDIKNLVKSFTFIEGDIHDNKELLGKDPGYLANLMALSSDDKAALLDKNWNLKSDGMNLAEYEKINELFTNLLNNDLRQGRYITCDHARMGRDLCVIMLWRGYEVYETHVYPVSDTNDIVKCMNMLRKKHSVGISNIIIDQDGIGVQDALGCKSFQPGGAVMIDKETGLKGPYTNLKTQCSYRMCEKFINTNMMSIQPNFYVDGQKSTHVTIGKKTFDIKSLIKKQIRTIKIDKIDGDKRRIQPKDMQKEALSGMSPDFSDTMVMRMFFDLKPAGDVTEALQKSGGLF